MPLVTSRYLKEDQTLFLTGSDAIICNVKKNIISHEAAPLE